MRKNLFLALIATVFLLALTAAGTNAQIAAGGSYTLDTAVTSNGGGSNSGGSYANNGTVGQPAAGTYMSGGSYAVRNGFWSNLLAPTAASVSVGGRVLSANGASIPRVRVTITDSAGAIRSVTTSSFGYYRFDELTAGETYILSINHKQFTFANPTQIISVFENITDLDFTANP